MLPTYSSCCWILAILLSISTAVSKGQEANDPFADIKNSPTQDEARQTPPPPDHLVPPTLTTEDYNISYRKLLTPNLKLDSPYLAMMLVMPSFRGEYSLLLQGDGKSASIKDSKAFSLTLTKSEESIWYSMPENNQENKQKEIKVKSDTVPITAALAARLYELWNRMILRTRYSAETSFGLDGVTIEFATAIGHGEVWTPSQRNSPFLLTKLGESLVQYCEASEETRDEVLKEINAAAVALETYLKEHPQEGEPKTGEKK